MAFIQALPRQDHYSTRANLQAMRERERTKQRRGETPLASYVYEHCPGFVCPPSSAFPFKRHALPPPYKQTNKTDKAWQPQEGCWVETNKQKFKVREPTKHTSERIPRQWIPDHQPRMILKCVSIPIGPPLQLQNSKQQPHSDHHHHGPSID